MVRASFSATHKHNFLWQHGCFLENHTWDKIREWVSNPIFRVIICGYSPGAFLLFSAWRIARKREITVSSPNSSRQSWRKPTTFYGKETKLFVNIYIVLGVFILVIATTIFLSLVLHWWNGRQNASSPHFPFIRMVWVNGPPNICLDD